MKMTRHCSMRCLTADTICGKRIYTSTLTQNEVIIQAADSYALKAVCNSTIKHGENRQRTLSKAFVRGATSGRKANKSDHRSHKRVLGWHALTRTRT